MGCHHWWVEEKKEGFNFIKEKVWRKLQGWEGKLLSQAGHEDGKACYQGQGSPPRHAAKVKAAPHGTPWHATKHKACCQGQGMLPRPRHAAKAMQQAKAKVAAPHGIQPRLRHAAKDKACFQGQGTQPRPRHAAKAMACSQGQGMLPRPRHVAKAKACSHGQAQEGSPLCITEYLLPPKERLGKNPLQHQETLIC